MRRRKAKPAARRKAGKPVRRRKAKPAARRKAGKPVRRKARKPVRRTKARPAARRKARKPVRRKAARKAVRRRPAAARVKGPRFPSAPARAGAIPRKKFSLQKLASRLAPAVKPPIEAYRGGKPYAFASYSHKNMKEVFGVIRRLADARYRIWYDEGIEPGNEWPEEVGRALSGCQLFVVFMSPSAMDSRNVRNEINFAASENKSVMVVNLQPVELSEGMKLQIGTVQFINKYEMSDEEFIEKMKRVLDPALRT